MYLEKCNECSMLILYDTICSLPNLPDTGTSEVLTYTTQPVMTLVPSHTERANQVVCSCFDWIPTSGHTKIIAGYSDGKL